MDWNALSQTVLEMILIPLLIAGTSFLIAFLNAKKKELLAKTDNEIFKKYIEMLDKTIVDCVLATNQTYVESLKSNGAFTLEAQQNAFKQTYEAVMAVLTDDAKEYLNEVIKDLNTYITNKIESQVVVAKQLPA